MASGGIRVHIYGDYDSKDIAKAMRDLKSLEVQAQSFGQRMSAMGSSLETVGGKIRNTGRAMTLGVTLPLVGIGVAAIKTAGDFEQTMNLLQVNAQASGKEMKSLSALAIKFGKDTIFSANDAADAMLNLSKGGLKPAEIQAGALKSTMALASASGMDLARAGQVVVQAMNTFGLKARDTAKAVDLLAAGDLASTASVEGLASGLTYVGSSAASLKIPLSDTVTALAELNSSGLNASVAGTSLNQMLVSMAGPTTKAQGVMHDLGLSFTDAKGAMLPMPDIIKNLQKALAPLSDSARNAALKDLFNSRGMRAANILLAQGADGWAKLAKEVEKTGVAQEMADARMKGIKGTIEKLRGSIETALLAIGDALKPLITDVADRLKAFADWFTDLDPKTQTLIVTLGAIAAAIGPLVWLLGSFVGSLGTIVSAVGSVVGAISGAGGLGAALAGLASGPVGWVALAIAALVASVILAWNTSEMFRNAVSDLWNTLQNAARDIRDTVVNSFKDLGITTDDLKTALKAVGMYIGFTLTVTLKTLQGIVIGVTAQFKALAWVLTNSVKAGVEAVNGALFLLKNSFIWLLNNVQPLSIALFNLSQSIDNAFAKIPSIVAGAVASAVNLMNSLINKAIAGLKVLVAAYNALPFGPDVNFGMKPANLATALSSGPPTSGQSPGSPTTGKSPKPNNPLGGKKPLTDLEKLQAELKKLQTQQYTGGGAGIGGSGGSGSTSKLSKAIEAAAKDAAAVAKRAAAELKKQIDAETKTAQDAVQGWLDSLKSKLDAARSMAMDWRSKMIGYLSLSNAFSAAADKDKAEADALADLTKAQADLDKARQSGNPESIDSAQGVLNTAQAAYQAAAAGAASTWIDEFRKQLSDASNFMGLLQQLKSSGAAQAIIEQIAEAGPEAGTKMAQDLINGGAAGTGGLIDEFNNSFTTFSTQATALGVDFANAWANQVGPDLGGLTAQHSVDKFLEVLGKDGIGRKRLNHLMTDLAEEMSRTVELNVTLNAHTSGGHVDSITGDVPHLAKGGVVTSPTLALIGDAGPEAVVPLSRGGMSRGGNTYQINVTAPVGVDRRRMGQELVELIVDFETGSGQVFQRAS